MGIVTEMVEDAMDEIGPDDIDDPVRNLFFYSKFFRMSMAFWMKLKENTMRISQALY